MHDWRQPVKETLIERWGFSLWGSWLGPRTRKGVFWSQGVNAC